MCLAQGHKAVTMVRAQTLGPSVWSKALYHWATALHWFHQDWSGFKLFAKVISRQRAKDIVCMFPYIRQMFFFFCSQRTSDGGNGNHSVSLPIILIKIKVDQMLPSSYISSLLVSILWFCIWFPISINVRLYFGAKMITFCIIHIGNRKIFLKHHSPPSPN